MQPLVVNKAEHTGWIEVICGSMFSGKTEELIRRLRRSQIARQHVEIFKPALDQRYSEDEVVSHNEQTLVSSPVDAAGQIVLMAGEAGVVGIDEAQFFGSDLVETCQELANAGKRVVVAGLDQDYRGRPFEPMPELMAVAEYVTKLHAVCVKCGAPANHSQRLTGEEDRVVVGEQETYEPRCRRCFDKDEAVERADTASESAKEPSETDVKRTEP
jgi:thymidine kinase